MAGDKNYIRKRKSPPSRPSTQNGFCVIDNDNQKSADVAINENEKNSDNLNHRTKKNVFFHANNRPRGCSSGKEIGDGNENRLPSTSRGRRNRLMSASVGFNGSRGTTLSCESDSPPRATIRQRRSVSAHPTLRSQPSVPPPTPKPFLNRTPSKSCLSPRTNSSDEQPSSSRSLSLSRQKVERLKLKSSSAESSDSEDESPRPTSRPLSQPLSPEIIASLTSLAEQNKQAWNHFSNHVKLIDDSTGLISRHPRKTFASSTVFQKAMHDMYGNAQYGKSRGFSRLKGRVGAIAACASTFISAAKRANAEMTGDNFEESEIDMDMDERSLETIETAKRGWRILRQYVQDRAAEKRMSQSNLAWSMLTHTIRGLSNMERTRYELYQKYGLVPMVLSDGTVIQENTMLSERARAAIAAKASNSGKPATQPTRHQSASAVRSKTPTTPRSIGGFKAPSYNMMERL